MTPSLVFAQCVVINRVPGSAVQAVTPDVITLYEDVFKEDKLKEKMVLILRIPGNNSCAECGDPGNAFVCSIAISPFHLRLLQTRNGHPQVLVCSFALAAPESTVTLVCTSRA